MLLALYGPMMGCDEMTSLRMKVEAQPETLFRQWKRKQWQSSLTQVLTNNGSAMLRDPCLRRNTFPCPSPRSPSATAWSRAAS